MKDKSGFGLIAHLEPQMCSLVKEMSSTNVSHLSANESADKVMEIQYEAVINRMSRRIEEDFYAVESLFPKLFGTSRKSMAFIPLYLAHFKHEK